MAEPKKLTPLIDFKELSKEALLEHLNYFQMACAETQSGYWVYNLEPEELYWSEEVYKIHGLKSGSPQPKIDDAINFYHPDDRAKVRGFVEDTIKTGQSYAFKLRIIRHDSCIRFVEATGQAVQNANGRTTKIFGTFRDITDIEESQQALAISEKRFELAIEAGDLGVWDWDVQKNICFWSGGSLSILGLDQDKITQKDHDARIHPEDRLLVHTKVEDFIAGCAPYDITYRIRHEDGHYVHLNKKGQAVSWDAQGNITRVVGSAQDITQRMQSEQELRRSNKDLERFAFVASHDLREPMRTITNFSKLLKEDGYDDLGESSKKYVDFMLDASERMTKMINDLLAYARVRQTEESVEEFEFKDIIKEVSQNLHALIAESRMSMSLPDKPDLSLKLNPNQFSQLIQNLIANSIHYKHPSRDPRIDVHIKTQPGFVKISFEDNGIGIEEKYQEKVFDIFYRVSSPKDSSSTGMGLATCKRIVELWGGEIGVESVPGESTCFWFTIPTKYIV